jgi:intracellular sulfur oxidation DsrE/DsrF family protein
MKKWLPALLVLFQAGLPLLAAPLGAQNRASQQSPATPPGYVFDITVQNVEQLDAILDRADKLKGQYSPNDFGRIELVLHGMELNLFRKKNYKKYMSIVDKARALDEQNLVDIKACQTVMQSLMIDQSELPDFIEQIPYAPAEIDRLEFEKSFTRL